MRTLTISVAGGGALGIGPLAFLCRLESDLHGRKICDASYAYAGTSTGSIIAAGLEEGYSAHDLFYLYKDNLQKIFTKYAWYQKLRPTCPKYDNSNLKKILAEKFQGKIGQIFQGKIHEWKKPIYIPTTCTNADESVEKVWDLGDKDIDKSFAILTSCSAPTYFDGIYDKNGKFYIDGGMWKNSPIDILNAGLINSGWSNFKILNLNTGMKTPNTFAGNKTLVGWAEYMISDWIARTSESGLYEVRAIIGKDNVFNANPFVKKKPKMDDVSADTIQSVIDIWQQYYDDNRKEILHFINEV